MHSDSLSRAANPNTAVAELLLLAQDSLEVAREVAGNPAIDDRVAMVLHGRRNVRIERALAGNPSTPVELLVLLGEMHADLVLGNPTFELLLAADPSALAQIPQNSLRQLASSPSVDPRCLVLMARMVRFGPIATAILENPATPAEALHHLASAPSACHFDRSDIQWHIHADSTPHRDWWRPVEEFVVALWAEKDDALLEQFARAGGIDSPLRAAGVQLASSKVRAMALARSPLPRDTAAALARPEIEESRTAIGKALSARGSDALKQFGLSDPMPILSGVSLDSPSLAPSATSLMLLEAVTRHVSWTVSHCFEHGSPHPDMRPMRVVAGHANVDERVLEAMIDAPRFAARLAKVAAESHAATPEFLRRISLLPDDPTLAGRWSERPREGTTALAVLEVVVSNPACPAEILRDALSRNSPVLGRAIARNPSIGLETMVTLAQRPDEKVRALIANRADLSPELVEALSADHSKAVKAALAGSRSVTDSEKILAWCIDKQAPIRAAAASRSGPLPGSARQKLSADKSADVRSTFASRSDLTVEEQLRLAADPSESVRAALSANRALLREAAAALLRDVSPEVWTALAGNCSVDVALLVPLMENLVGNVVDELTRRGAQMLAKPSSPVDLGTLVALATAKPSKLASFALSLTHPTCPEAVLRKRAKLGVWQERALIASNPATPDDLRAELRRDWAWPVVAAADAPGVR